MLLRDKTPSAGSREEGPESVVVGESQWSFFLCVCVCVCVCVFVCACVRASE